jgi:hypothetical protein
MGATRRNLQAQPKILKKLSEHQIYQSGRKFFQKSMLSTLKVKNSYGGYPSEFAGSTQNPKKIIETPNIPIKTKVFLKKTMFRTLKV